MLPRVFHEKQVLHERHFLIHPLATNYDQTMHHRSETLHLQVLEHLVGGQFGMSAFEVTHGIPVQFILYR